MQDVIRRPANPAVRGPRIGLAVVSSDPGWDALFPELNADKLGRGWGEGVGESPDAEWAADPDADADDEERLRHEVPPHYGD